MDTKSWQVICNRIVKDRIKTNDMGYVDLFKDMDMSMQTCFEKKQITNGSVYNVYLTNRTNLEFMFHEWFTQLSYISGGKKTVVISENNYHSHQYYRLHELEKTLKAENVRIGVLVPKEFIKCIKEVGPGELVSFSDSFTYACFDKQRPTTTLKKCADTTGKKISIFDLYDKAESYRVNTDKFSSIYEFYTKMLDKGTVLSARKMNVSTKPQQLINRYTNDLDEDDLRELKFGPFKVRVTRSASKRKLLWYDDMGNRISMLDVKIMIAWLNISPIVTDFNRKDESSAADTVYDEKVKAYIEKLYSAKRFKDIFNLIKEYCKKQKKGLRVTLKTYNATKKGFEAVGIAFACTENNEIKTFKLSYEGNDINNDIANVAPTDIEEFSQILANKHEGYVAFVKDKVKENIKSQTHPQKLDLIAEILAKNEIEARRTVDMLGEIRRDDMALAKSYAEEADKIENFRNKDNIPKEFIMLCGLPGSGKTEKVKQESVRLNTSGMTERDSKLLYPIEKALIDNVHGKSEATILKSLREQPNKDNNAFTKISLNGIRQELFEHHEYSTGKYLGTISKARVTAALAKGYTVIYDAMNLDAQTRKEFLDIAKSLGVSEKKLIITNLTKRQAEEKNKDSDIADKTAVSSMLDRLNNNYPSKAEGWTKIVEYGSRDININKDNSRER